MKKKILLFSFALFALPVCAQDIIVFADASEIEAKVTDVTAETVSYFKWNAPDGPKYTVNKSEVFYIKYQSGEKDVISADAGNVKTVHAKRYGADGKFHINGIRLQSYIYAGAIFSADGGGPAVDLSLGVRLWDYGYVGIETGFHSLFSTAMIYDQYDYYEYDASEGYIPVGINMKGYIPTGRKIYPYVNCSLGGFFGVMDMDGLNGFYCQVGAGIDVKRFSFGIGYSGLVKVGTASCGYVKLGIRLGKW